MRRCDTWTLGVALLIGTAACSSSESVDPEREAAEKLATEYCAQCCVPDGVTFDCVNSQEGCTDLITETLLVVCQAETTAYYQCLIDNGCEIAACDAQWTARETCLGRLLEGEGGAGGDGT